VIFMSATRISRDMVLEFARRSRQLIAAIKKAIADFYSDPPVGSSTWELWHTPRPWETKALTNLSSYQDDIDKAIAAFDAGDSKPIETVGSYYASLSKDMDFDMTWMSDENRVAVVKAIDDATEIADRIHRVGYAMRHHSA
jgi:hypothetical protein